MYFELPVINGLLDFLKYINVITDGYFGPSIVAGFFALMFLSMKNYESEKAFASSIFLATVLCFFLWLVGLTMIHHLMLTSIGTLVSIFGLKRGFGSQ